MKIAEGGLLPEIARPTAGMPADEAERTGGDVRALETPALTSVHTVWLREHNRKVLVFPRGTVNLDFDKCNLK